MRIAVPDLSTYVAALFTGAGVPSEDADRVADNLLFAELRGVPSHGLSRVPVYLERLETGGFNRKPTPQTLVDLPALSLIDGDGGLGAVIATYAMQKAITMARSAGSATVFVRNSNHFGMASYFTMMAAKADMVGMAFTNASAAMAAWGGVRPVLGTNPIALSFPDEEAGPVVVDMATTLVARGKIREAQNQNKQIPAGWAFDAAGAPTTDPDAAIKGTLAPMGGVKGYCLGAAVDLLSGVLSGAGFADRLEAMHGGAETLAPGQRVGHCFVVMNTAPLMAREERAERMAAFRSAMREGPKAPGVTEILLPGELEARREERLRTEGLELGEKTVQMLRREGDRYGLSL
jgi:LDH2 family malate/lactate/ureidoglycolate dehydrogenase